MIKNFSISPHVYAVLTFLFFALMNACIKGLHGTVPLPLTVLCRFGIGFLVFIPVIYHQGGIKKAFTTHHPWLQILRAMTGVTAIGCSFYVLPIMPLGDASALGQIYPFLLVLISIPFLGEKAEPKQFAACILGFIGVILIARPHGEAGIFAACIVVLASCASAFGDLTTRKISRKDQSLTIVIWFFFISTILSFIWWLMAAPFVVLTSHQILLLLGAGILGSFTQFFVIQAFKHLHAGIMGPYSYLGILLSTLFGWLFFNEVPTLWMLAGVLFIISGVQWNYLVSRRANRSR